MHTWPRRGGAARVAPLRKRPRLMLLKLPHPRWGRGRKVAQYLQTLARCLCLLLRLLLRLILRLRLCLW